MNSNRLSLTFDSRTIGDLGVKMYTRLPHALAESISNAYDADAKNVTISIQQGGNSVEYIKIEDDGVGMSRDDLEHHFLVVGRKRRKEDGDNLTPGGRRITGRKGLGKLAMFGIANVVEVRTVKGGKLSIFEMDWDVIEKSESNDCFFIMKENKAPTQENNGTIITLTKIKRKTESKIKKLEIS